MRIAMAVLLAGLPLGPAFSQDPKANGPGPALPIEAAALAFSADGARLVTGGHDRVVRVWDVASRRELRQIASKDCIESVSFSPDGKAIAFSSMTWKAEGGGKFTPPEAGSSSETR